MAGNAGTSKSKTGNLEEKQGEREVERRNAERTRTQDLNQGMDTGTRDSVRHGVDWGSADSGRTVISRKRKTDNSATSQESEPSFDADRQDDE
jgi:hypothetical protein